jgi:hypothetical protein
MVGDARHRHAARLLRRVVATVDLALSASIARDTGTVTAMTDPLRRADEGGGSATGSGHPPWSPRTALLPDLGPVCQAVLFRGLIDGPAVPASAGAWQAEAARLVEHRLAGLALAAAADDGVGLPTPIERQLRQAHGEDAMRTMAVDVLGARVVTMLDAAGIPSVVTKGPGVARSYPDPSLRTYMDLDVMVDRPVFARALALLRAEGYDETVRLQAREYFHRYCREAINLVHADGTSVDLHHTVPPWYWGRRLRFDELLSESDPLETGSGRIRLASPAHNLLVACLHVVSDKDRPGYGLRTWRDVVALATICDPDRAAATANGCGLAWWVRFILDEVPPSPRLASLRDRLDPARPGPADRARLSVLLAPRPRLALSRAARLPAPNAVAFLAGEAVPSRQSIETKLGPGRSYLDWWRYGVRRMVGAPGDGDDAPPP